MSGPGFGRRRSHDPELMAAAYVSGEQDERTRSAFETHLLECEDCWREVRLGREGRRVADMGRELTPPGLRDDVRAAVLLSPVGARRRPSRALIAAAVAVVAVGAFAGLTLTRGGGGQPAAIRAALADYRIGAVGSASPTTRPAPDLAAQGLLLESAGRTGLDGLTVDAFSYGAADGARVLLFLSDRAFPVADGATEQSGAVHGWRASQDGLHLVCGDGPVSYLLVSRDPAVLARIEGIVRAGPAQPA